MNLNVSPGRRRRSQESELADFYVPKPDFGMVILKENVAFDFIAEAGRVFEFAIRNRGFERFTAAVVFQHFLSVEPVFDVVAAYTNL